MQYIVRIKKGVIMARLRTNKKILHKWLVSENWQAHLNDITNMPAREVIGPLLSFLLLGGEMTHRAAMALGMSLAGLAEEKAEDARNILRRFMWHMNEESGNIGWGIPEAFAESLVHSPRMAKEFHPILLSYIMDTGRDDNFCDHAILRRSCYWAVGRFVGAQPKLCTRVIPWLLGGLNDEDIVCRGMAIWALCKFPKGMLSPLDVVPLLKRIANSDPVILSTPCVIFDDLILQEKSIDILSQEALALYHA